MKDTTDRSEREDPILTIRIPRSSWTEIVRNLEKFCGRGRDEIEILSDFEIVNEGAS